MSERSPRYGTRSMLRAEFAQRRAQRFERDVQNLMLAVASGGRYTFIGPDREYAERVEAAARERLARTDQGRSRDPLDEVEAGSDRERPA